MIPSFTDWPLGEFRTLTVHLRGNTITVMDNNREIMEVRDEDQPYLTGMAGLRVEKGGRLHCRCLSIHSIQAMSIPY